MDHATQVRLLRRLMEVVEGGGPTGSETQVIDVERYLSTQELERERAVLFRRRPVIAAHRSELEEPGAVVRATVGGVPLILVRDGERLRGFVNACRHRGARLVDEARGCHKALTCPYHAWTYRLDGSLMHVPREESFTGLDPNELGLAGVAVVERHGFVWVQLEGAPDVGAFLGETLEADFAALDLAGYRQRGRVDHRRAANWKLVMDAFAEGYHLQSLHRKSLARFFLQAALVDDCSPHVRQIGARRDIEKLAARPSSQWRLLDVTTLFYNLFPNSVLVFHPDWLSLMTLEPDGPAGVRITHRMLVAPGVADDEETNDKLQKSFALIDGQVFQKEDFAIAESVQSTLGSGANRAVLTGGLERGMQLFHAARDAALASG